ncbi:hypothetical protein TSOC_009345 [Tetrabaena socialis]|uniref:Uncharacterized protein n=1 Tax=Tetrabaena socialis TaxID=47790 RepID=A0A2J7ZW22_9CHLO|nr:hypothetical protein TSOC_009345 [Tetrabaena socialis]|eukprot:PNH04481.1 hypothetical protein TSOC_009345 [Tetrabaena socialis]
MEEQPPPTTSAVGSYDGLTFVALPTLRQIVREEGMQALWQGLKPRVLFHIPAAAVCWGTYETVKDMLRGPP